ncbi:MAG: hypothetical protein HC871_07715, partial [Rhizobiales bacterium]|nr:hypothetical protein [Hyphomicrobiales bacterium]
MQAMLAEGLHPAQVGRMLNEGWHLKRQLASTITNGEIDAWYEREMPGPETAILFDEAKKLGKQLLNGLEGGWAELEQIFDPQIIGIRGLRWDEREILQRVYGSSLPRMNNLLIVSLAGTSGRPFTIPASFVVGVANLILPGSQTLMIALVALAAKRGECYF